MDQVALQAVFLQRSCKVAKEAQGSRLGEMVKKVGLVVKMKKLKKLRAQVELLGKPARCVA